MSGGFRGDNPSELDDVDKECFLGLSEEHQREIIKQGYIDKSGEKWLGHVGFIGPLLTNYLKHDDPKTTFYLCGPAPMTVTVIDSAANTIGLKKENVLFDDFTGTLTPSLDLIYQKLMIAKMFKQLDLHQADKDIETMTAILIIKLILRDKIDESYIFLDKIKETLAQQSEKEFHLNKLFEEYE